MTLTLATGAPPQGDVIFVSCDPAGSFGPLPAHVLGRFGLDAAFMPDPSALVPGYAVKAAAAQRFCFVVTVGDGPTARNLRRHLTSALSDTSIADAVSLWIPLMGTGAGELSLDESREVIVACLEESGWTARPSAVIIVSGPGPDDPAPPMAATGHSEAGSEAYAYSLPIGPAVDELLRSAARLHRASRSGEGRLTTAMLFLALAQSGVEDDCPTLAADPAAAAFRVALHRLAGDRFAEALEDHVDTTLLKALSPRPGLPEPDDEVQGVLARAFQEAAAAGHSRIDVDPLIEALFELPGAGFGDVTRWLGLMGDDLLQAYLDERSQFIELRLLNDLAGSADRLGYDRYAQAIFDFLKHAETSPPLSISIQAPWGAGKSSLMHQVRERLDPASVRRSRRLEEEAADAVRLTLAEVLKFLKRRRDGDEPKPDAPVGRADRRWTVWFNAWKYDTSEQVWAGLVDAVVSQISDRLDLPERELFFLRLHLARIDDGLVRRKIYDRIAGLWWAAARRWILAGAGAVAALFGAGAAAHVIAPHFPQPAILEVLSRTGYAGALAAQVILAVYVVASYFLSRAKTHQEPAAFSLSDYVKVPDYTQAAGALHVVHKDLLRVLELVPGCGAASDPIVIFIDDLDRCSPSKIAMVVEGVSMFLAGDLYRCMFVIGMDPQLVAAALETEYAGMIAKLPTYERTVPLGWRFMDKFVQLPFTIPPSGSAALERYVESLGHLAPSRPSTPTLPPAVTVPLQANAIDQGGSLSASAAADEGPATALKRAVRRDVESRDVGALILELRNVAAGNPRELKRMANLARLYLELRNARRRIEPTWTSPSLNAYARWIALTCRWPDALRWLLWGADEASWLAEIEPLTVRRLRFLEETAGASSSASAWQADLSAGLRVPVADPSDWGSDVKLFDFFTAEARLTQGERLSSAAGTEFW